MATTVSPARRRFLERRNQRIYQLYIDDKNPRSYADIAEIMKTEGHKLTKAQVGNIVRDIQQKVNPSQAASQVLTNAA